jgi:D-Tyr-tRNAtyr deacylase
LCIKKGGRVKGRMVQYHNNVNKEKGLELYEKFIELCRKLTGENDKWKQTGCKIEHGTYGIRQVYSTETNGPYLHMIEF